MLYAIAMGQIKKGRKDDTNNYRPVSLTCILCKLMESIVRDKVMEHFVIDKLFTNRQFGFLKGQSTHQLEIIYDWTEILKIVTESTLYIQILKRRLIKCLIGDN